MKIDPHEDLPLILWVPLVKHRANYRCERCGSKEYLDSHHIDEDRAHNTLANGECACKGCHTRHHNLTNPDKYIAQRASLKASPKVKKHLAQLAKRSIGNEERKRKGAGGRNPEARAAKSAAMLASWEPGGARRVAQERATS
jgi:hypothetical protein